MTTAFYHQTKEAAFADKSFHSRDVMVPCPNELLEMRDCFTDFIVSGGESISLLEVASILGRHPAVRSVAVVAKPDETCGETPCAFIELKADASVSAEELQQFCRLHLAGFMVPKYFHFMHMPKISAVKVEECKLRERAEVT
jgi:fatty-acyl-CoA synthase